MKSEWLTFCLPCCTLRVQKGRIVHLLNYSFPWILSPDGRPPHYCYHNNIVSLLTHLSTITARTVTNTANMAMVTIRMHTAAVTVTTILLISAAMELGQLEVSSAS